jgi:predicted component of viral defense system (DUF524 family)
VELHFLTSNFPYPIQGTEELPTTQKDVKILILSENNVERLAFKNTVQRKVILISET